MHLPPAPRPGLRSALVGAGAFLFLGAVGGVLADTGDALCDPTRSTQTTCVIIGSHPVAAGSVLRFDTPNVRLDGTIAVAFSGHCAQAETTSCTSDDGCAALGPCLRTGDLGLEVSGRLDIEARGRITARGEAQAGDHTGPDGGLVSLTSEDLHVAGEVSAASKDRPGVPAGNGGRILVRASGTVALEASAALDASAVGGGCGGTILIGDTVAPTTIDAGGRLTAEGDTRGGVLELAAVERVTVTGALEASNTNTNRAMRAACPTGRGGGQIGLRARRLALTGRLRALGRQASGGKVLLEAERELLLDSGDSAPAIRVSGGDVDAFSVGGEINLHATAGDVLLRRGAIEADGESSGFGSDSGSFDIVASSAGRCQASGAPCTSSSQCAPAEACVETGGVVEAAVRLSARGGAGAGFGCAGCRISGRRSVTVSGPIDVGGGGVSGLGGDLLIAAADIAVGPGSITADAGDGGSITLLAGDPLQAKSITGTVRIANGTQLRAEGRARDGWGGDLDLNGCSVTLEAGAVLATNGGPLGLAGSVRIISRDRLTIGPLVRAQALPDGEIELIYRTEATLAADASFAPDPVVAQDPDLAPCPACGNGTVEPPEVCDGAGSCLVTGQVCVEAGIVGECTCLSTCGTVPGVQPGEECDGTDTGGRTCISEGFSGGSLACTADCSVDTTGCLPPICGDGVLGTGEACDVGGIGGAKPDFGAATCASLGFPAGGSLTCSPSCRAIITTPHCSLSVETACTTNHDCPDAGEACVSGCFQCGNGVLDPDEQCDDGVRNSALEPDACRNTCRAPSCGDDVIDVARGEQCDDGADSTPDRGCTEMCVLARCGDGRVCSAESCTTGPGGGPEQCDDGNSTDGDACETGPEGSCALRACGNGVLDPGEQCDDGNATSDDDCDANCTLPRCGNLVVDRGEECDPPSPCCLPSCLHRICDDGNSCTTDACDPASGCVSAPAAGPCNDGNACTTDDTCSTTGGCTGGTAVSCDTGDPCRIGICDSGVGCSFIWPSGFDGLRCLSFRGVELRHGIAAFDSRLGKAQMRRLGRSAAGTVRALDRAVAAGPGRVALAQLRTARRRISTLTDRLLRLRRKGRLEEPIVRPLTSDASALGSRIDAVIAELQTPRR